MGQADRPPDPPAQQRERDRAARPFHHQRPGSGIRRRVPRHRFRRRPSPATHREDSRQGVQPSINL